MVVEYKFGSSAPAKDVETAMQAGRVEKWVVHTDPLGNVTVGLVDAQGKTIVQPTSLLMPRKP